MSILSILCQLIRENLSLMILILMIIGSTIINLPPQSLNSNNFFGNIFSFKKDINSMVNKFTNKPNNSKNIVTKQEKEKNLIIEKSNQKDYSRGLIFQSYWLH